MEEYKDEEKKENQSRIKKLEDIQMTKLQVKPDKPQ